MIKTDLTQVNKTDKGLWICYGMFLLVSAIVSFSSNSQDVYKAATFYSPWISHMTKLLMGLVVIFFMQFMPVRVLRNISPALFWISIFTQILCFVPGIRVNNIHGVYRTIHVPGFPMDLQPDEYIKFTLILYLAIIIIDFLHTEDTERRKNLKIKYAVATIAAIITVIPYHTSTAMMYLATAVMMVFVSGLYTRQIIFGIVAAAIVGVIGVWSLVGLRHAGVQLPWRLATVAGRVDRFIKDEPDEIKYNIKADPKTAQLKYCKISIANGAGIIGTGPGKSLERDVLPVANADCVFAIIVEEWGWIGILVTLSLYMFLLNRVGYIVKKSYDDYMSLVALSCGLFIALQALISIICVLDIMPATGQPLPFISVGGNSALSMGFGLGTIMCISKAQRTELNRIQDIEQTSEETSRPVITFDDDNEEETPQDDIIIEQ
ncbi:MAG TPA: hypothetical protein DEO38_05000 [Bacteroidales bacterium]|nr:hypothetical protein [Bacteroidales bacterium]